MRHQLIDRTVRFLVRVRNDHAFTRRQPIRFNHDWKIEFE